MNKFAFYLFTLPILFVLTSKAVQAQDPNFTQFYAAPTYLNPAFTGTAPYYRITANHRKQWINIPNAYQTTTVGFEYEFDKWNTGLGFLASQDKSGALGVQSTNFSLLYGYKVRFRGNWQVRGGLQITYGLRSPNFSALIFEDQLISGMSTIEPQGNNSQFFNFSSGVLVYNEKFWLGIANHNWLQPNQSIVNGDSPLPRKFSLHTGIKLPLDYLIDIAPALLYQVQGGVGQLDIGANLHLGYFIAGLWYRGLPLFRFAPKTINQDALAVLTGVQYRGFYAGLSYDFRISALKNSGGSYELAIIYHPFHDRRPKGDKYIKCPAFY